MTTEVLKLMWRHRPSETNVGRFGGSKTERYYLDFIVDNKSLYDFLGAAKYDFIGCLGWANEGQDELMIKQLLLEHHMPIHGNRQMLFVCPECGDLGCGAITAEVSFHDGQIVWRDFAYENDYDPEMTQREEFRHVGPFVFDFKQYSEVLSNWPPRDDIFKN